MMTGLSLTLLGLLLGLVSSSVAVAAVNPGNTPTTGPGLIVGALPPVVPIVFAVVLLVGAAVFVSRRQRRESDRTGQAHGRKASAVAAVDKSTLTTGPHPLNDQELERLLDQHIQQCAAQADALAVIAIKPDGNEERYQPEVAQSLFGLARSRGARLVQSASRGLMVLAPGQLCDQAHRLAEDLHQSIVSMALPSGDSEIGVLTASVGLVVVEPSSRTAVSDILANLDRALGRAERRGGNRIEVLEQD
ncbi:MAG: GGDEF domain-containing protein [Wenzhouxiangella sp.]|nr:MAG: GGDEF domain-containing protein [Wenzhouxiangella sp.]